MSLRSEHDYMADWRVPDEESDRELERNVEQVGRNEYFEQVNARGESVPPEQVFGDMIGSYCCLVRLPPAESPWGDD